MTTAPVLVCCQPYLRLLRSQTRKNSQVTWRSKQCSRDNQNRRRRSLRLSKRVLTKWLVILRKRKKFRDPNSSQSWQPMKKMEGSFYRFGLLTSRLFPSLIANAQGLRVRVRARGLKVKAGVWGLGSRNKA